MSNLFPTTTKGVTVNDTVIADPSVHCDSTTRSIKVYVL